jgi:uroporphyrinogen decarboxylase
MATDLDCFLATTEHRRPARILYHAGFTDDLHRRVIEHIGTKDIAGHYGFYQSAGLSVKRPEGLPPLDHSKYWEGETLPEGTTFDGHGVAMVPAHFFHFWGYISPLRNAESPKDIEDFPLDDATGWDFSHMPAEVEAAHAAGKVAVGWVGHMYESAWQIRGYEQFLLDTIERPAWAECLLERLFQQNMIRAVAYAKAGADLITTGDDVASQKALMFAPDTWRRLIHSRWAKVWRAIKEIRPKSQIWYHSDGNVAQIVPELVEAGLDILNPLQPECLDLDAIHKRFGARLAFDGTIGTQSTMPWGTPAQVEARVREVIESYGRNGGLIISPTHVLEPEVPLANIDALFEACREYGTFE